MIFPAIFLDRDGVIIENRSRYVRRWSDVRFLPAALEALARIAAGPHRIVIATNQSGVGRGYLSQAQADEINERVVAAIVAAGGRIDGVYMCPHHPAAACACRKPRPGLLLRAAADLSIDLGRSLFIGDALTDLEAARAAGLPDVALVRTGRGRAQLELPEAGDMQPFAVYDDLNAALSGRLQLDGYPHRARN